MFDAVHLYSRALLNVLDAGENPYNGTAIINYMKETQYKSAMGWVYLLYYICVNVNNLVLITTQLLITNMR